MYEIDIDRTLGRINIKVWGFWDDQTLRSFSRDHIDAVKRLHIAAGRHTIMGDMRGFTVQSAEIIAKTQQFLSGVANKAQRTALVASGAIVSMQAKRMATVRSDMRIFATMHDAETWLSETA